MQLLGHSWVFNDMLKEKKIAESSKFMIRHDEKVYTSKKLVDCLSRKEMSLEELEQKLSALNKWCWELEGQIEDIEEDLEHNPVGYDAVGMGYVMANTMENKADDASAQV